MSNTRIIPPYTPQLSTMSTTYNLTSTSRDSSYKTSQFMNTNPYATHTIASRILKPSGTTRIYPVRELWKKNASTSPTGTQVPSVHIHRSKSLPSRFFLKRSETTPWPHCTFQYNSLLTSMQPFFPNGYFLHLIDFSKSYLSSAPG